MLKCFLSPYSFKTREPKKGPVLFATNIQPIKVEDVNGHILSDVTHFHNIYHVYQIYRNIFSRDSQKKNAPDDGGVQRTNKNEETSRSVKIQKDHMNKVLSVNKETLNTDITWTWGNMALSRIKTNEKIGC